MIKYSKTDGDKPSSSIFKSALGSLSNPPKLSVSEKHFSKYEASDPAGSKMALTNLDCEERLTDNNII
jgi:hypothetical protein